MKKQKLFGQLGLIITIVVILGGLAFVGEAGCAVNDFVIEYGMTMPLSEEEAIEIVKYDLAWRLQVDKKDIGIYGIEDDHFDAPEEEEQYTYYIYKIYLSFDEIYEYDVIYSAEFNGMHIMIVGWLPPPPKKPIGSFVSSPNVNAGVIREGKEKKTIPYVLATNDNTKILIRFHVDSNTERLREFVGQKVKISAFDEEEFKEQNAIITDFEVETFPYYVATQVEECTYDLSSGWNLIAIPVKIDGFKIKDLQDIININGGNVLVIASANGSDVYTDLSHNIIPGEGIFINVTNSCSFSIGGELALGPVDLKLNSGWNVIGIPIEEGELVLGWDFISISPNGREEHRKNHNTFPYTTGDVIDSINLQGGKATAVYIISGTDDAGNPIWKDVSGSQYTISPYRGYLVDCEINGLYMPPVTSGEVYIDSDEGSNPLLPQMPY